MDAKYTPLVPFILVLCHFAFDWVYQSHKEALAKSKNRKVRLWHCVKYAVPFVPVLMWFGMGSGAILASLAILFGTHYVIDSYVPVMLWAKYLRRAPEFDNIGERPVSHPVGWQDKVIERTYYPTDVDAFIAFARTPLGLVLMITMDQFLHIACLLPVAMLAMR